MRTALSGVSLVEPDFGSAAVAVEVMARTKQKVSALTARAALRMASCLLMAGVVWGGWTLGSNVPYTNFRDESDKEGRVPLRFLSRGPRKAFERNTEGARFGTRNPASRRRSKKFLGSGKNDFCRSCKGFDCPPGPRRVPTGMKYTGTRGAPQAGNPAGAARTDFVRAAPAGLEWPGEGARRRRPACTAKASVNPSPNPGQMSRFGDG